MAKTIKEFDDMVGNSHVPDPIATGDVHANRSADNTSPGEPMETVPGSKAEIISYLLSKVLSGTEGDAMALYDHIKKTYDQTSNDNAGNLATIATHPLSKESVESVFDGTELSEEAKEKAFSLFEAAVKLEVAEQVQAISEDSAKKLQEQVIAIEDKIVANLDEFFEYFGEQWMEKNKVAVTTGLRAHMAESLFLGLKSLLEAHHVDLPEQVDVIEQLTGQVADLEKKVNESIKQNMAYVKKIEEMEIKQVLEKTAASLETDVQRDKLRTVAESIAYNSLADYKKKVEALKETIVARPKAKRVVAEDGLRGGEPLNEENNGKKQPQLDPEMAAYIHAANRFVMK